MGLMKRQERSEAERWNQTQANYNLKDVYMYFELKVDMWCVTFAMPLGEGMLPRVFHFADPDR